MRIIIVGAGVAGTSTGIALKRLGHEVRIYDQIHENKPVGAALSLWPNGVKVLNWLGLGAEVAAMGGGLDAMAYRDGHTGEPMTQFGIESVARRSGQRPYAVARAELQLLLMESFGLEDIRLGMRMTGVEDDGEQVTVAFENGQTATGDVLLAADGARSLTRDHVLGRHVERRYAGYTNFNGLVPADPRIGPVDVWTSYVADGKRAAVMPVGGDRFYFFADVPQPAGTPFDRADGVAPLREAFAGWAPGVGRLLDAIDPVRSLNRVEIWDLDPLETLARGRVALIGDAAHNLAPDIGQGACSALEDAFVMGLMFATTTLGVEDTLRRYEANRRERVAELLRRARSRVHEMHAVDPAATRAWYDGLRTESGEGPIRGIIGNMLDSPVNLGVTLD